MANRRPAGQIRNYQKKNSNEDAKAVFVIYVFCTYINIRWTWVGQKNCKIGPKAVANRYAIFWVRWGDEMDSYMPLVQFLMTMPTQVVASSVPTIFIIGTQVNQMLNLKLISHFHNSKITTKLHYTLLEELTCWCLY